jgi:hypothetical protein
MAKRRSRGLRLYVRHYCNRCGSRIFPFDKYEDRTVAPDPGKKGGPVLLQSSNSDPEHRTAWCWSCDGWVPCVRKDEREILKLYLARRGVVTRKG